MSGSPVQRESAKGGGPRAHIEVPRDAGVSFAVVLPKYSSIDFSLEYAMWYFIVGCFLVAACTGENLYADIADTVRTKRQNHQSAQPQHEVTIEQQQISYRPYNEAPDGIKKLVELLRTPEPLVHLPVQQAALQLKPAPAPAPEQPTYKHAPLAQPAQYAPKIQFAEAPEQPNYKGIQAIQAGIAPGPLAIRGQPTAATSTYTPQYKSDYNAQQQQLDPASVYKAVYNQQQRLTPNGGYKPPQYNNEINQVSRNEIFRPVPAKTGLGQYQAQQQSQYPKNLPPHIKKIIDSQRAYQG